MAIDTRVPIRPDGLLSRLQRAVIAAGGEWIGAQESIPPIPSVVVFRNPTTSTVMNIPIPFSPYADFSDSDFSISVHEMLEKDGEKYLSRKIVVPVEALNDIRQRLQFLTDEIDKLIGRKS